MKILEKILDWLERVLPGWIAMFSFGYRVGTRKVKDLEKEKTNAEIGREQLANKIIVDQKFDGLSDDDIIAFAEREGRKPSDDSGSNH